MCCGGKHALWACKFKFERCFRCGKTWHIAKLKVYNGKSRVRSVTEESRDEQDDHVMVYTVDALKSSGIRVPMCIDGTRFDMQLDTAADVSLLPESLYREHLSHSSLSQPASVVLKIYENQTVDLVENIMVIVKNEEKGVNNLPLIIALGTDKAALFGLLWLEYIRLNWQGTTAEGNHCLDKCRERPTTHVSQTKVSSMR